MGEEGWETFADTTHAESEIKEKEARKGQEKRNLFIERMRR